MNKSVFLALALVFVLSFSSLVSVEAQTEKEVYFFYGIGCPHCAEVEDSGVLEQVEESQGIEIQRLEIYANQENRAKYLEFAERLGLSQFERGIPMVVISCEDDLSYLIGDRPIIENLEEAISSCAFGSESGDSSSDNPNAEKISLAAVVFGALIDSVNPCAFGVLIFLMIGLLKMGSAKRALKFGLIYSFVVFVVYFLIGLFLKEYLLSYLTGFSYFYIFMGVLMSVFALIEFKDFFWYGKGISLKIPAFAKSGIESLVQRGTLFAILLLGIFVAIVEAPCTGGPYLAVLTLLESNKIAGVGYLLLYNLIFVLPLVIISFLIYSGEKTEKIKNWVENNKRYMRLAMGVLLAAFAVYFFSFGI